MTKALAVKEENPVTLYSGFEDYAGLGSEEVDSKHLALPFLRILAQLSPQVNKRDGKYVQGAEPGMLWNTVTNEVYSGDDGVVFVPVYFQSRLVEWVPKERGGGFVGSYSDDDPIAKSVKRDERNRDVLPNGNELVTTAQYFGFLLTEDGPQRVLIVMSSTQLKKSRKWLSMLTTQIGKRRDGTMYNLPFFANAYRLKTVEERNDKGSWFGWDISKERPLNPATDGDVIGMAVAFVKSIRGGEVQVKHSRDDEVAADKDDIPF